MRIKPLPRPPESLEAINTAWHAVPLVPTGEADCCARLVAQLDLDGQDEGRRWLTLLWGLDLVTEGIHGFSRMRAEPDLERLPSTFTERVYGAPEALRHLESPPRAVSADEIFEGLAEGVPAWERHRDPTGWRELWRRRTRHLLDWLVLLGCAERLDDDGLDALYRAR